MNAVYHPGCYAPRLMLRKASLALKGWRGRWDWPAALSTERAGWGEVTKFSLPNGGVQLGSGKAIGDRQGMAHPRWFMVLWDA